MAAAEPGLPPGARLGHYVVRQLLATGGMAEIYEAYSAALNQRVAIKILRPALRENQEAAARFANEARAINLARDSAAGRGVPTIHDLGALPTVAGGHYLVMELLSGTALRSHLPCLRVGERELSWLRQLAAVLAAVHDAGIVHRDLKPENVMLVPDAEVAEGERVVLIDFGVAKLPLTSEVNAEHTLVKTRLGSFVGSPQYAAPEQRGAADMVDGKADVYAFGVLLYELLAGRLPFSGTSDGEQMMQHIHAAVPPLRLIVSGAPWALQRLALRMLAKEPGARPTMAEVQEDLSRLRTGRARVRWPWLGGLSLAGAVAVYFTRGEAPPPPLPAVKPAITQTSVASVKPVTRPKPPESASTRAPEKPRVTKPPTDEKKPRDPPPRPRKQPSPPVPKVAPSPPQKPRLMIAFQVRSPSKAVVKCDGAPPCSGPGRCEVQVVPGGGCKASAGPSYQAQLLSYEELDRRAPGPIEIRLTLKEVAAPDVPTQ